MAKKPAAVNNAFYDELGQRWLTAQDDPVALLRAEGVAKQAWMEALLDEQQPSPTGRPVRILDVGCGAGFLANRMATLGHSVQGLDYSLNSLRVAQAQKTPARYHRGDALHLPFQNGIFDVVCAMDFLEHVEDPCAIVSEAARVLRPGGLFFFHTFNRNFLAWLVIIKGLEWFVRNTPHHMHILRLFITPAELENYCRQGGMQVRVWTGVRPDFSRPAFWRMLMTGVVPRDFRFVLTPSLRLSYLGMAEKN